LGTQLQSTFASWSEDLRRDLAPICGRETQVKKSKQKQTFGLGNTLNLMFASWSEDLRRDLAGRFVAAKLQSEEIKAKADFWSWEHS
jgi:hypothetical protein